MPQHRRTKNRVHVQPNTYEFAWNGRRKFVDAIDEEQAKNIFMEIYGLHPDEQEGMSIVKLGEK